MATRYEAAIAAFCLRHGYKAAGLRNPYDYLEPPIGRRVYVRKVSATEWYASVPGGGFPVAQVRLMAAEFQLTIAEIEELDSIEALEEKEASA